MVSSRDEWNAWTSEEKIEALAKDNSDLRSMIIDLTGKVAAMQDRVKVAFDKHDVRLDGLEASNIP